MPIIQFYPVESERSLYSRLSVAHRGGADSVRSVGGMCFRGLFNGVDGEDWTQSCSHLILKFRNHSFSFSEDMIKIRDASIKAFLSDVCTTLIPANNFSFRTKNMSC